MLLDKKEKEKTEREPGGLAGGFITITFLGYYDRKAGGHTHYRYTVQAGVRACMGVFRLPDAPNALAQREQRKRGCSSIRE